MRYPVSGYKMVGEHENEAPFSNKYNVSRNQGHLKEELAHAASETTL